MFKTIKKPTSQIAHHTAMYDVRSAMCDVRCAMPDMRFAICDLRYPMCDVTNSRQNDKEKDIICIFLHSSNHIGTNRYIYIFKTQNKYNVQHQYGFQIVGKY